MKKNTVGIFAAAAATLVFAVCTATEEAPTSPGVVNPAFAEGELQKLNDLLISKKNNYNMVYLGNVSSPGSTSITVGADDTLVIPPGKTLDLNGNTVYVEGGTVIAGGGLSLSGGSIVFSDESNGTLVAGDDVIGMVRGSPTTKVPIGGAASGGAIAIHSPGTLTRSHLDNIAPGSQLYIMGDVILDGDFYSNGVSLVVVGSAKVAQTITVTTVVYGEISKTAAAPGAITSDANGGVSLTAHTANFSVPVTFGGPVTVTGVSIDNSPLESKFADAAFAQAAAFKGEVVFNGAVSIVGDAMFESRAGFMKETDGKATFGGSVTALKGIILKGGVDFGTGVVSITGKADITGNSDFGATTAGREEPISIEKAAFNSGLYTGVDNLLLGGGDVVFTAATGKAASIELSSTSLNYGGAGENLTLAGKKGVISDALVTLKSGGVNISNTSEEPGKLTFKETGNEGKDFVLEVPKNNGGVVNGFILESASGPVTIGKGLLKGTDAEKPAALKATGTVNFNIANDDTLTIENATLDISESAAIEIVFKGETVKTVKINEKDVAIEAGGTNSFIDLTEGGHLKTSGGTASDGVIAVGVKSEGDNEAIAIISGEIENGTPVFGFYFRSGQDAWNKVFSSSEFESLPGISAQEGLDSISTNGTTNDSDPPKIAVFATMGDAAN